MERRRLYLDCSWVWRNPSANTGIERVTRNLGQALLRLGALDRIAFDPVPVAVSDDGAILRLSRLPQQGDDVQAAPLGEIATRPGDVYFVLDSTWDRGVLYRLASRWQRGLVTGVMQYDVIPLEYPALCADGMPEAFSRWLAECSSFSDFFACISETTRAGLIAQLAVRYPWRTTRQNTTFSFRLGNESFDAALPDSDPPEALRTLFDDEQPVFLSVGTIEPRKQQGLILTAFDSLWASGSSVRLCLIGKQGWHVDELVSRIKAHPEFGKRLFWFPSLSDGALRYAYLHSHAVICASRQEGFGLPVLEALTAGRPVLLSDIPVFHEVAGRYAVYFDTDDAVALGGLVERLANQTRSVEPPNQFTWPSWEESALEFIDKLDAVAYAKLDIRARVKTGHKLAIELGCVTLGPPQRETKRADPRLGIAIAGSGGGQGFTANTRLRRFVFQARLGAPIRWLWGCLRSWNTRVRLLALESDIASSRATPRLDAIEAHLTRTSLQHDQVGTRIASLESSSARVQLSLDEQRLRDTHTAQVVSKTESELADVRLMLDTHMTMSGSVTELVANLQNEQRELRQRVTEMERTLPKDDSEMARRLWRLAILLRSTRASGVSEAAPPSQPAPRAHVPDVTETANQKPSATPTEMTRGGSTS